MHVLRRATENQEMPLELPKPLGRVQMLRTAMHRYMQMLLRILQRDWELCKYTAESCKNTCKYYAGPIEDTSITQNYMKKRARSVEDSAERLGAMQIHRRAI